MQKSYYEKDDLPSDDIVGNYKWHENFPYETQLLYKNGDLRMPLIDNLQDKIALDFGCGPGRMVNRISAIFKRVDGVDISKKLLEKAKQSCPKSNFYISSGDDLGSTPSNTYDFAYSTIAMQHIAVHSVRMNILKNIKRVLKKSGKFTIQIAFNADYPFIVNKGSVTLGNYNFKILKKDKTHAFWHEDKVNAKATNSACDVAIGYQDIPKVIQDFETLFSEVDFWFYDVRLIYNNLNGEKHASNYWPSHWIFISGINNIRTETKNATEQS